MGPAGHGPGSYVLDDGPKLVLCRSVPERKSCTGEGFDDSWGYFNP